MKFSDEQIEWIVGEVIRRLGLLQVQGKAASPTSSTVAELVVAEKVVTMRSIEKRLASVTRVVVSNKAVITPSVRDELKARNIELVGR